MFSLMGHLGLEPRTIRLKAEYSTIELVTPDKYYYTIFFYLTILKMKNSLKKRLISFKSFAILYVMRKGSVAQLVRAGDS